MPHCQGVATLYRFTKVCSDRHLSNVFLLKMASGGMAKMSRNNVILSNRPWPNSLVDNDFHKIKIVTVKHLPKK